jgi:ribosomal protein S18 acetylase RimI-like enzyme
MAITPAFPQPSIRRYQDTDWPEVWSILHATIRGGDVFAFSPDTDESEMHRVWISAPSATFVACAPDGRILGTYFIKPNQPGLGSHVCNAGYAVAPDAQRQGVASAMCVHSQATAASMGFRAMQFNMVVSTNERAVALWQRHGFVIVGTLPGAFQHQRLGFVDAFVMHKALKG